MIHMIYGVYFSIQVLKFMFIAAYMCVWVCELVYWANLILKALFFHTIRHIKLYNKVIITLNEAINNHSDLLVL